MTIAIETQSETYEILRSPIDHQDNVLEMNPGDVIFTTLSKSLGQEDPEPSLYVSSVAIRHNPKFQPDAGLIAVVEAAVRTYYKKCGHIPRKLS